MFNRKSRLLEGYKGVLNFTNTILESDESLPDCITKNDDKLIVDDEILNTLERRLKWSDELDSNIARCNQKFEFPRMNKWTLPEFGPTLDRKELNVLTTYADCSELLMAKQFGHFYYPRVISPKYEVAFKRGDHRCILDLKCDFVTLQQNPVGELLNLQSDEDRKQILNLKYGNLPNNENGLFCNDVESTIEKELIDIEPLNWEINFDLEHFYSDDQQLNKPNKITEQNVDTLFLGNNFNIHKQTPDRIIKGKLLLYLYGFAVGRARRLFGNCENFHNESNYKIIEKPITIKGVFANYSKRNLGFACLQLNTLSFDSVIKNQVWFDGPYDIIEDRDIILNKLALMNLNSYELLNS